jgi:hypothetical protein
MKRSEIKKAIEETITEILGEVDIDKTGGEVKVKKGTPQSAPSELKKLTSQGVDVTIVPESQEDDEFDAPEKEPSKTELKKIDKEFGSSKLAKELSPADKERLTKLETGIRKKLSNPTKENIAIVQQLINRADIKKLFKDGGKDLKALISDIIG